MNDGSLVERGPWRPQGSQALESTGSPVCGLGASALVSPLLRPLPASCSAWMCTGKRTPFIHSDKSTTSGVPRPCATTALAPGALPGSGPTAGGAGRGLGVLARARRLTLSPSCV